MAYMSLCQKRDLKMDFTILNVSCVPGEVLVKFQGRYMSSYEHDYHILKTELQLVSKVNEDLDIGEFCLVQDKPLGLWHRGKILDKVKQKFEVVLIDQGSTVKVDLQQIASATGELFTLPPKVVNGIFSNILPLGEKWSPRSRNFFSSLVGEQHNGHVKTFLPHQVILLEVPKIINNAIELDVAKYIDSDTFCLLVELIHKLPANSHGKQMPDLLQQKKLTSDIPLSLNAKDLRFQKVLDHLKPAISVGVMEKIKISSAMSPDRFYCQILSWEAKLRTLTTRMCSYYESLKTEEISGNYGMLCAAKRKDGLWYRCIIQTLLSCNEIKVFFFDIGSSETIVSADLHQLKKEFLILPMLSLPCALSRVNYHTESAKNMQLLLFKRAVIGQIVIAYIDEFCSEEKVFSISLYEKEYELHSDCHLTNQQVPMFSPNSLTMIVNSEYEGSSDSTQPEASVSKEIDGEEVISVNSLQMEPDSIHVAYVEYVLNPSNFWIRTDAYQVEFNTMMAEIAEQYNKCELMEMVIDDPKPGQLCCALYAKDGHYYRAVITKVHNPEISVYFIDFGNTETVSFYEVKVLLPKFSTLPALAMGCTLAYAFPQDDVWVKSANDAFKEIVNGKPLLCHVLAKRKFQYVVEMRPFESSEGSDIVSLLVKAGHAEFWKVDLNSGSVDQACQLPKSTKCKDQNTNGKKSAIAGRRNKGDIEVSLRECKMKTQTKVKNLSFSELSHSASSHISRVVFKQYIFKPGAVMFVKCSHVESPGCFWCQLSCNLTALDNLMDELQTFYTSCNSRYKNGQMACVARSPNTGKYYRASVVNQVSRNEVDVVFVDYGRVERVLSSELREIKPQFLQWEGQAFRCCLSEVVSSFSTPHAWSASACKDFTNFIESATNLKSIVITLFSHGTDALYNAVELEYPFSENHWKNSKGQLICKDTIPSVHLHTFCYSTFDLEVGTKENIYITFIHNTGKFYCHLAKNENAVDVLMSKVSDLGKKINPETGEKLEELYIVKYTEDGDFYRALVHAVDSDHVLAFFVDFGDSHLVKKNELLPIPEEAADVLFEPMQAIPCYLSGLKDSTFTTEANDWFEEHSDKPLSATVVSIDEEGQLELDLICGTISVNGKIKEILGVQPAVSKNVLSVEGSSAALPISAKKHTLQDVSKGSDSPGKDKKTKISDLNGNAIAGVNFRFPLLSSQNSTCNSFQNEPVHETVQASKLPSSPQSQNSLSPPSLKKPLKSTDLPQNIPETGSTHLVYASSISSPSEFYIQLAEYEKQVLQLEEELNAMSFQPIEEHLEEGDLVVAQYLDDKAFYRAEVKNILKGNSFEVEFIDYGNTAKVDFSSIFKLPDIFFKAPRLSIPVFLTGVHKCQNGDWSKNVVDKFSEKITNESLSCVFLCRHDRQWEVSMTLKGESVTEFFQSTGASPESSSLDNKYTIPRSDMALKSNQIEKVENVYLLNSGLLFVTLARYTEESKISEQISAAVKQADNRLMAKDISEGMVCLVKSERMQTWFRANVEKIFLRTTEMSVFFVDHGAREIISMHNAKSLPAIALSLPHQAIPCKWIWMEKIGVAFFQSQMQSILQKELHILFLTFLETESCWKVDVLIEDVMLMEHFNTTSQQIMQKISNSVSSFHFETESLLSSIPKGSLGCLELHAGFVVTFQTPNSFCVQLENSIFSMNKLSKLLKELTNNLLPFTGDLVRLGSACLVECFEENVWCRAEIASINMSSILLNLVDYGIYKSIPYSDYSKLKVILKEIASLPALTYHCKLHGVLPKNKDHWPADAIRYCMDFIRARDLLILPIKDDTSVTEVFIYGNGNLTEKLIVKGLATDARNNGCFLESQVESIITN
ncbi:tudor domain-containing protein 15 [Rana temporaria]|uniref:tudor domain-containing protein 15 n=1 Tax=Rana temporaria TaxID=8407 RepID=UPI001AACD148|nr:tudor domain-containing protein 15 [Rana temporaria]